MYRNDRTECRQRLKNLGIRGMGDDVDDLYAFVEDYAHTAGIPQFASNDVEGIVEFERRNTREHSS